VSVAPPGSNLQRLAAAIAIAVPALRSSAAAEPPRVVHLFPSGACAGDAATVTLVGFAGEWPPGVDVEGDGLEVRPAAEKGKLDVRVAAAAAPGARFIRLFEAQGAATPRPFLVGTVPELLEKEMEARNEPPGEAQPIPSLPVTVNGRLGRGDADSFAVRLDQGQALTAVLDAFASLGSPLDGVLQVVSPDGFVLAQADDDPLIDPRLTFTAPASGAFVVRVFAFPASPDSTIGLAGGDAYIYRLTLATAGAADHVYPLAVPCGRPAHVTVFGPGVPDAARVLAVSAAGDAPLVQLHHPALVRGLCVRRVPWDCLVEDDGLPPGTPRPLRSPCSVSGRIQAPGDRDRYELSLEKDARLVVSLEARSLGSPLDPVLRLIDPAGKVAAEADDAGDRRDPELELTAPAAGAYTIEVLDLHGTGSTRHVYLLTAAPPAADFRLAVGVEALVVPAGGKVELEVSVERRHGLKEAIEIALEGLPAGLEAKAVTSPGEGDAARKVKLEIVAAPTAAPTGSAFRVMGKSAPPASLERRARAALPGVDQSTERLWITVTAK
jgi:hypothetical protein